MADSKILRPLPQRTWQLTPASLTPPSPATPAESPNDEKLATQSSPSRTRSILNLTSSTLFGIYQSGAESFQESISGTPWGTGAMTPASPSSPVFGDGKAFSGYERRPVLPTRKAFRRRKPIDLIGRTIFLFVAGISYGAFISRLYDHPNIRPVKIEGVNRSSWNYLIFWGVAGALVGNFIPWLEMSFEDEDEDYADHANGGISEKKAENNSTRTSFVGEWIESLRGIGVFIGISYAIRRLSWESSSQAALTLALVNPVLWYLVDRSRIGFTISTTFAIAGTFVLLAINPDLIPLPPGGIDGYLTAFERIQAHGLFSTETVGVFTWLASVVFCSCVCFRGIGKRLVGFQEYT